MSAPTSNLFDPISVGPLHLQHRVVLAPLTRFRANKKHVIGDLAPEYYSQRGSTPGTLLISESIIIAPEAAGFDHMPGIWSEEQVAAWKRVTKAVHAKGSYIVAQLMAAGRFAMPESLKNDGFGATPVAPYAGPTDSHLRALTKGEIAAYIESYKKATRNAIAAGFDAVELHVAHGDLVEQFFHDTFNQRTDEYGGSIENRSRFALEILDAITAIVGQERVGIRFTPWSNFQNMRMANPIPALTYIISEIKTRFPTFMYLHMAEPRMSAAMDDPTAAPDDSNDFARKLWAPRPYLAAGGFSRDVAEAVKFAEKRGVLLVLGRAFIANPDLPVRIRKGIPLNPFNPATFAIPEAAEGYIDQPFAAENLN
ncbi:FMN-linked oxidoreductase [Clavulina sp. PMI_390]|nr:FMN-linked oxidoreductase [Clavulina sp. PMI_390]